MEQEYTRFKATPGTLNIETETVKFSARKIPLSEIREKLLHKHDLIRGADLELRLTKLGEKCASDRSRREIKTA